MEDNEKSDYLSKLIDYDDWGVSVDFFQFIDSKWGPHTVERFANANNRKLQRFNSGFFGILAQRLGIVSHKIGEMKIIGLCHQFL